MAGQGLLIDMTGQKFGFLTVIRRDGFYRNTTKAAWLCRCECGKEWLVEGRNLRRGFVVSCGCKHRGHVTHDLSRSRMYSVWQSMKARCSNPNNTAYPRYGGRGIRVDPRWLNFERFVADMGEAPDGTTMDRIDNDGPYSPENCRWATPKEQANNTRRNVTIKTSRGDLSILEAAQVAGITYIAMQKRLALGLTGDDLLLPKYSRLPLSTTS
jgi:hypothetical protein